MKVIFLDFDGVLVTVHDRYTAGSPYCVHLLNDVINRTGAKIVVSSAWRYGSSVEELAALLKEWGVNGEVIDKTPVIRKKERGNVIQEWLDQHPVEAFVILDDDSDMAHLKDKLVKCHYAHGMDTKHAEAAVALLGAL